MHNLTRYISEAVSNSANPKSRPDVKTITLRLPLPVHGKLETIQRLVGTSKTVVAEDILVNAVEDVWTQMGQNPQLDDFWEGEALARDEREEEDRVEAEYEALRAAGGTD